MPCNTRLMRHQEDLSRAPQRDEVDTVQAQTGAGFTESDKRCLHERGCCSRAVSDRTLPLRRARGSHLAPSTFPSGPRYVTVCGPSIEVWIHARYSFGWHPLHQVRLLSFVGTDKTAGTLMTDLTLPHCSQIL